MANQKRSEVRELQDYLASNKLDQKKQAVRKIIDAMTRGKDVSMLFIDIEKNIATSDIEFKKLIYLYLINYAKNHPDQAILCINSLRKDAMDKVNPLLRALAIRTMGCIRVKQIAEYLLEPLKAGLKDEDSYVRKTAALCVAKLYDLTPELIEEQGFLKHLEYLLNDGNAFVVSNALAALQQIQETKGTTVFSLTPHLVQKLLTAMNECTEWGQIIILDALAQYAPQDSKQAENILERVSPRLSHSNSGVILSTVRVLMKYLDYIQQPEKIRNYCRKLQQPLISLLGNENELTYVALKNINLVIQKRPNILDKELKIFFCNFNDPIYIKLEKLDILVKLANQENIQQILHELKEYTNEVDVEFVRKSIRCIGRLAIKIEKAAEKCMFVLTDCLKTKINYIVQETIIVVRDIFRKYPRKYEGILKVLHENLKTLDDPEAKAAMIWIIGEYVDTIENADDLLNNFIENFKEEPPIVQIQILTSCVKLFLLKPQDTYELIQNLLNMVTTESENPDLRDRGFIYWRLLSYNPELAKKIVFAERPTISDSSYTLESELLDQLISNIGTLSSLYNQPPEKFVKKLRDIQNLRELQQGEVNEEEIENVEESLFNQQKKQQEDSTYDDYQTTNDNYPQSTQQQSQQQQQIPQQIQKQTEVDLLDGDLLGGGDNSNQQQQQPQQQNFSSSQTFNQQCSNIKIPHFNFQNAQAQGVEQKVSGIEIDGAFQRRGFNIVLELKISNKSNNVLNDLMIKFNKNSFNLQPENMNIANINIRPGESNDSISVLLNVNGQPCQDIPTYPFKIQIALKTNLDVFMFVAPCSLSIFLMPCEAFTVQEYLEYSQRPNLVRNQNSVPTSMTIQNIKDKFKNNNVNFVGSRKNPQGVEMNSFSCKTTNNMTIILDTILDENNKQLKLNYAVPHDSLNPLFLQAIQFIVNCSP